MFPHKAHSLLMRLPPKKIFSQFLMHLKMSVCNSMSPTVIYPLTLQVTPALNLIIIMNTKTIFTKYF